MMSLYTRFRAHQSPVLKLISHEKGIISIDKNSVKLTSRNGLVDFEISNTDEGSDFQVITQMALTSANEVMISTDTSLIIINLNKKSIVRSYPYKQQVILMASNKRHVALGLTTGTVDIFELSSAKIVKSFTSASGKLSELDLKQQTLVTCGYTERHGSFVLDPLVNVYDLRLMKPLAPIPFPAGAAFVRLYPKLTSIAIIASKSGQLQVVDMFNPSSVSLYQADVGPLIIAFELSFSGDFLSIIDGYSLLHLWSHDPEHSTMSQNIIPLEYPTLPEPNPSPIGIDDQAVPLNCIGLPYYKEALLSAWPKDMIFKSAGTLPKSIDPEIYKNCKEMNGILYSPYDKDKYGKRNTFNKYTSIDKKNDTQNFLSSKSKNLKQHLSDCFQYKCEELDKIPPAFKKLEILYSKFGVDDFDFASYNETEYSGLETHVDNSYTNSLLQAYRFIPEFYNCVLSALGPENLTPNSLLTELGYLYDMLTKAKGQHFRPTNFQHALSNSPEANELGLIEIDSSSCSKDLNLSEKINLFNKFLIKNLSVDGTTNYSIDKNKNEFNSFIGILIETQFSNYFGQVVSHQQNIEYSMDLYQPKRNRETSIRIATHNSILSFIEAASYKVEQKKIWNQLKNEYQLMEITQCVKEFPTVLSLNLHLLPEDIKTIRGTKNWLKPTFYTTFVNGRPYLGEFKRYQFTESSQEYELTSVICEISSNDSEKRKHLITFSKILNEETNEKEWFLFNDFLVMKIPQEEVLNLSYWWKTPVNLIYRRINNNNNNKFITDAWKSNLNDTILYRDHFAKGTRENKIIEYELLTREEAPKPGSLIAIDAEFVTLQEEQFEINKNGNKVLIKPSIRTLARVSVLRGDPGEKYGVPFIDDYVVVKEGIQDYLTSFSGIEHGDLDPETSKKSLVTRETVYRKLWLLLNLGCVFVGHGLANDFRMINICVPKEQVRDTALFFYKGSRILSLRFLSHMLLGQSIQTGNHDSIEDALTALQLYNKYLRLKKYEQFDKILDQIYKEGKVLNFKPPGSH